MRNDGGYTGGSEKRAQTALSSTWSMSSQSKVQALSDFGSVLLAIAGHDLRQPLQEIQSAHDLLGLQMRTESELRLLRSVQVAIDRLGGQLDQLLAAIRLRDPEGLELRPVQLDRLLQQVGHENEFGALKKGIRLRVVPTFASIQSDALLLSTILRNLVNNAVKYTDPGGRILVGCRRAGDSVRIEVRDTGIGIAEDQMPRIFDAFTLTENCPHDSHGVGLFIVRQAVAILGHRLEITSAPSHGSRFSILARQARIMVAESGRPSHRRS
jgi:two-component system, OmpR family, phosphate regulon sensor histidine kinase PhoR